SPAAAYQVGFRAPLRGRMRSIEDFCNALEARCDVIHQRLRRLALRWAEIADEDLSVLAVMPQLEELNLNESPVTDASLVHVGRTANLRSIELHHDNIHGTVLESIARLRHLQQLRLSGTEVSDEGISLLGGHTALADLDLEHTKITDQGLAAIANLPNLQR